MNNTKTGITICAYSEMPSDAIRYRPENGWAKKYTSQSRAVSVCEKLLKNEWSGYSLGKSFNGFFVVVDDRLPSTHELNMGITIWFH
jgi:hypothetical protein